jgi:hypothetical protein
MCEIMVNLIQKILELLKLYKVNIINPEAIGMSPCYVPTEAIA